MSRRILALDALRGLAVALMIEQHVGIWLWSNARDALRPLFLFSNGLGGLAAPSFFLLAGAGAHLMSQRVAAPDRTLLLRGLVVVAFGYLLNLVTPSWFGWGSWFALHLIGLGLVASPLLRRLPTWALFALGPALALVAAALHGAFEVPLALYNRDMRDLSQPGGALALALLTGHFPVLPWLALVAVGHAHARHLDRPVRIALSGLAWVGTGVAVGALGLITDAAWLEPFTRWRPGFYPATPTVFGVVGGVCQLLLAGAVALERRGVAPPHILVTAGRASLTFLFVHVVVFREGLQAFGGWRGFDSGTALVLCWMVVALFWGLSLPWSRVQFAGGMEWVLRKLVPTQRRPSPDPPAPDP